MHEHAFEALRSFGQRMHHHAGWHNTARSTRDIRRCYRTELLLEPLRVVWSKRFVSEAGDTDLSPR